MIRGKRRLDGAESSDHVFREGQTADECMDIEGFRPFQSCAHASGIDPAPRQIRYVLLRRRGERGVERALRCERLQ